ncbi:MAG TPA: GIY-YIG nuclease family protein [Longimicrobiales bacterium]|nr:GIY-YIG nuclease family protein [Longimicrobiales bacterium]
MKHGGLSDLPGTPGVYLFRDRGGTVLYVGKARNLRRRVSSYFRDTRARSLRIDLLVRRTHTVEHIPLGSEDEALLVEAGLIKTYTPRFNIRLRDDKQYPLLRVRTGRNACVNLVRCAESDGAEYFGPCPRSTELRQAITTVRRLYTLDHHTFGRDQSVDLMRRRTIRMSRALADSLTGRDLRLRKRLLREMRRAARSHDFERAARLRSALDVLGTLARYPAHDGGQGVPSRVGVDRVRQ